jgi:diguanylate cyclase (GGDEF)-like protein/PAS domain S-box-containing protein
MDHLSANAFMKDSFGTIVYANGADAKMFGLSPEECVGKNNFDLMPRAIAEELRAHDRSVMESGCERKFNELLTDYEGNVRHWLTYKFPFHNRSGEAFLGGISVEITEMVQVQNALRESESRYRQIVEYAGDIIVRCDRQGRISYINEMGARVLKFIAADLRGRRALKLIRPGDRKRVIGVLRRELAAGTTDLYIEIPVATGDGAELWLGQTIRVLRTAGVVNGLQAISQDITERRRMEAELRSSEERFRLLYENSPVAYHEIDRQSVIRRVNRAECEMLGIPAAELVGVSVIDLIVPGDREIARAAIAAKVAELQPLHPFQRTFLRRDGRRVRVEIHENLMRDAEGRVTGIHSVLLDITQRQLGETLDEDRREISEMIAQRQSLDGILRRISLMITHYDESLCCVPLRLTGQLDEPKLEPVCAGDHAETLCQAIQKLGTDAFSLWPSQEFEVSHLTISDLAGRPTTAAIAAAASQLQMQSCWSIPVVSSAHNPLGMLLVFSPRVGEITPAEQQLLRTTSRIAAVGIENRSLSDLLAFQASHDGLTRLPNRVTFETRLEDAILEARGSGERLAVFYVDLDRFKQVNDTFGHSGGDELLRQVGTRLRRCIRQTDLLARIGGDEFALLLPALRDPGEANRVAEAILRAFHPSFDIGGSETFVTASIGISFFPDDGQDVATLQRNSDSAMYRVKNTGRNSFRCYTGDVRTRADRTASQGRVA